MFIPVPFQIRSITDLKASFWGLLGLIPGNLFIQELKFFRLIYRQSPIFSLVTKKIL